MLQDYMDSGVNYFGNQIKLENYLQNRLDFLANKLATNVLEYRKMGHRDNQTGEKCPDLKVEWMSILDDSVEHYMTLF